MVKVKDILTAKQEKALRFIIQSIDTRGCPPTVSEIGKNMGLSLSGAKMHVQALVRKGYLKKKNGARRALQPIEGVRELIGDWRQETLFEEGMEK